MTDIVERLRSPTVTRKEVASAADEIERLRAERDALRALLHRASLSLPGDLPGALYRDIDVAMKEGGGGTR